MTVIVIDPLLRSLHGDPRFDAMLRKLKLDDWKRKVSPVDCRQGREGD